MQVAYDIVTDKAYIENNGTWEETTIARVKGRPANQVVEKTNAELAREVLQKTFEEKSALLQEAIRQAKEKAGLFQLGIETQENFDRKKEEYAAAKIAYDAAKAALEDA